MYLVGTAMLIFGTGLHVMFVGTQNFKGKGTTVLPKSNFFGLFYLEVYLYHYVSNFLETWSPNLFLLPCVMKRRHQDKMLEWPCP